MPDSAALELHRAAFLVLSRDSFYVLQVAFLAIAGVLAHFVIGKRLLKGRSARSSPLGFALFSLILLGTIAVFTKLWGYDHAPFAFGYGVCFVLSLVDPVAAVGFLLANSLIRPWELSDMAEMAFLPKTLFALVGGSWVVHAARARKLSLQLDRPSLLFYALAVWFLLSALLAGDFMEGLTKYSGNVLIAAIVFVLVSNAPQKREDVDFLRQVLVASVCGLIVHALMVTMSQPNYDPTTFRLEDAGTVGNSNDLAALITFALPLAVVPVLIRAPGRKTGLLARAGAVLSVLILSAGLGASQSRGAILALVIGALGFGVARARDKKVATLAATFGAILVFASSSLITFSRDTEDLEGSKNSRIAFMLAGINMGVRHPILGIGHDNFARSWDEYAIGQTYESGARSGHSTWLIAFAENGFPGLCILIALFFTTFRRAIGIKARYPELIFALIAYGVAMTFLNHAYTIYPYLIFALILSAWRVTRHAEAT